MKKLLFVVVVVIIAVAVTGALAAMWHESTAGGSARFYPGSNSLYLSMCSVYNCTIDNWWYAHAKVERASDSYVMCHVQKFCGGNKYYPYEVSVDQSTQYILSSYKTDGGAGVTVYAHAADPKWICQAE
jgi:hypothetical protein